MSTIIDKGHEDCWPTSASVQVRYQNIMLIDSWDGWRWLCSMFVFTLHRGEIQTSLLLLSCLDTYSHPLTSSSSLKQFPSAPLTTKEEPLFFPGNIRNQFHYYHQPTGGIHPSERQRASFNRLTTDHSAGCAVQ